MVFNGLKPRTASLDGFPPQERIVVLHEKKHTCNVPINEAEPMVTFLLVARHYHCPTKAEESYGTDEK